MIVYREKYTLGTRDGFFMLTVEGDSFCRYATEKRRMDSVNQSTLDKTSFLEVKAALHSSTGRISLQTLCLCAPVLTFCNCQVVCNQKTC